MKRLFGLGVAVVASLGVMSTPAAARPIEQGRFHDVGSRVIENFCGDLTVREAFDIAGSGLVIKRGRDGFAYFAKTIQATQSWSNLATGKTYTQVSNTMGKDLKITDNGDGTLTVLVLATGSFKVYVDGEFLFTDPGQVRFEILVDHGGTPTDPSDDVELGFLRLVKGSTGRNDLDGHDFCTDIHTYIG